MVVDPFNHIHKRVQRLLQRKNMMMKEETRTDSTEMKKKLFANVLVEVASSVLLLEQVIEWNKR
jgi:hypothetical protein